MIQHHKWNLSDIENLVPFERQVYVLLLQQWIKEENERIRLAEIAQKEREDEENRRMKEWEKKFDEEQRLKEEELVRKFYSDEIPDQENNQDGDNLEIVSFLTIRFNSHLVTQASVIDCMSDAKKDENVFF